MLNNKPKIFAHRGFSSTAPENTMIAFELAIQENVDGIELDIQMTSDRKLVIIHDETVNRTTNGSGWVKNFSLKDIKKLDSGTWFSPVFVNQTIPTLSEVLELVKGTDLCINIELKNNKIMYPKIEELVVKEIEQRRMENRVILSSFNHRSLRHLHLYRPKLALGALYENVLFEPWVYAKHLGVSAIHPFYLWVTDKLVHQCHAYGIQVRPYTVDRQRDMKRLISWGVDGIITNFPNRLRQLL
jgi:glycerophosphoryl diester phosphodiesterase